MARELELRCECSKRPLLGVCGRGSDGKPFVHIKVHKQSRLFAEIVARGGDVHIRCRECQRWHIVTIRHDAVNFVPAALPSVIEI